MFSRVFVACPYRIDSVKISKGVIEFRRTESATGKTSDFSATFGELYAELKAAKILSVEKKFTGFEVETGESIYKTEFGKGHQLFSLLATAIQCQQKGQALLDSRFLSCESEPCSRRCARDGGVLCGFWSRSNHRELLRKCFMVRCNRLV